MKSVDVLAAVFAYLGALAALMLLTVYVFFGYPPRHCRYMVPVTNHPGVYSCSEYPKPLRVPR